MKKLLFTCCIIAVMVASAVPTMAMSIVNADPGIGDNRIIAREGHWGICRLCGKYTYFPGHNCQRCLCGCDCCSGKKTGSPVTYPGRSIPEVKTDVAIYDTKGGDGQGIYDTCIISTPDM